MAHGQFPNQPFIKTFNTGVVEKLCRFVVDKEIQLTYIVLSVLKNGESAGTESMQLKIYSSWDLTKPVLITSAARLLSETGAANAESWIGRLRFDFDGYRLSPNDNYYLAIETTNYTRDVNDFYLGAVLDWPDEVYDQSRSIAGAQIRVIGAFERGDTRMATGGEIRQVEIAEGTVITAPSDMTVPSASVAAVARFFGASPAPVEEFDVANGAWVMRFSFGGTEKAIAFVKVPQGYLPGTPIVMYISMYSPSTSNTIKLGAITYLVEKDTDAMSTTADSRVSTNAALTNASPANRYRETSLDLTDSNGLVGATAVAAGDTLRVELQRSALDTDTADIRFVPDMTEVQFNG